MSQPKVVYLVPKRLIKRQTRIRIDEYSGITVTTSVPALMEFLQQRPEFTLTGIKKIMEGETIEITGTFPKGKLKELARWIETKEG